MREQIHPYISAESARYIRDGARDARVSMGNVIDALVEHARRQGLGVERLAPEVRLVRGGDSSAGNVDTDVQEEP